MTPHAIRCRRWPVLAGHFLMLGLLALMGPSCDKMPLTAPSNTTITLYAARLTVGLGGSVEITATVIESAGTPVQNGTVVTFTATLGSITPLDARTSDGKVTVLFNAGSQSGTAEIRALSGGNSVKDALKLSVGAAAASRVDLLANPTALPATGGSTQLTAIVTDASGNRIGGVPVSFSTDNGGFTQSSATTDGVGEARTTLSTTAKAVVSASVAGGSTGSVKSDSLTIQVRVGPTVSFGTITAGSPGTATTIPVTVTAGGAAVRTANVTFGDGPTQSIGLVGTTTLSHAYSNGGNYVLTATAIDAAGETGSASASVFIQNLIVVFTAFSIDPSVKDGVIDTTTPTNFSASASTVPAGGIVERYEWSYTMAGCSDAWVTSGNATSSTSRVFKCAGTATVSVRAVTTTGAAGTTSKQVVVQ